MSKKISIIMGIYNCGTTLSEAIDSIINQTYDNWELIMCDDGSKDNTREVAQEYVDRFPDKMKLLINEKNMGLNYTLNCCLNEATGEYIARMDGDDISLPHRFEKEVEVLENNPQYAIVSSAMIMFDENGEWGKITHMAEPKKADFVRKSQFCHAPCLVRKEAYFAVEGYSVDKKLLRVEDYHLWIKMYAKGFIGFNIQEALYKMRDDQNAQKRRSFKNRINEARVKSIAIKEFKLPFYKYVYCLKPILLGLTPGFLYKKLHRKNSVIKDRL